MPAAPHLREITSVPGKAHETMVRLDRNARSPHLLGVPKGPTALLRALDIAVIGIGSVGLPLVESAARLGVRRLLLVDRGYIKPESVLTHPVQPAEVGRPKASLAGERAKAINPHMQVFVFDGPFEELATATLVGVSAVFLASDNLSCEVAVGQLCTHLSLPLIQASVYGPTLTAQVRALSNVRDGPCLVCEFVQQEWEALDRGTRFSCEGGTTSSAAQPSNLPTRSWPHLCALAANLALFELLRRSLAVAHCDPNSLIEYCGYQQRITTTPLARRADCPADHTPWSLAHPDGHLADSTPRQLLTTAGCNDLESRGVSVAVEGYRFAESVLCGCPQPSVLTRFVREGESAGVCAVCGVEREPHPLHTWIELPGTLLVPHLERPLREIGVASPTSVRVRHGDRTVMVYQRIHAVTGGSQGGN